MIALLLAAVAMRAAEETGKVERTLPDAISVHDDYIYIEKSTPNGVIVLPRVYGVMPPDYIQEYDFYHLKPLKYKRRPVKLYSPIPPWAKGVRVYGPDGRYHIHMIE